MTSVREEREKRGERNDPTGCGYGVGTRWGTVLAFGLIGLVLLVFTNTTMAQVTRIDNQQEKLATNVQVLQIETTRAAEQRTYIVESLQRIEGLLSNRKEEVK